MSEPDTREFVDPGGDRLYGAEFFEDRISVFETAAWDELPEIDIGRQIVDLAISPDGSMLAASGEGFVTVIDLTSGVQQPLAFDAGESEWATFISNVAFNGNQHIMLAASPPGPVYVMTLDPNQLVDIARSRVTRGFTEEECAMYALDSCPTLEAIRGG